MNVLAAFRRDALSNVPSGGTLAQVTGWCDPSLVGVVSHLGSTIRATATATPFTLVQVGGVSSGCVPLKLLSEAMPTSRRLVCIDDWLAPAASGLDGYLDERPGTVREESPTYERFLQNIAHINDASLFPLRARPIDAVRFLHRSGVRAHVVYVDLPRLPDWADDSDIQDAVRLLVACARLLAASDGGTLLVFNTTHDSTHATLSRFEAAARAMAIAIAIDRHPSCYAMVTFTISQTPRVQRVQRCVVLQCETRVNDPQLTALMALNRDVYCARHAHAGHEWLFHDDTTTRYADMPPYWRKVFHARDVLCEAEHGVGTGTCEFLLWLDSDAAVHDVATTLPQLWERQGFAEGSKVMLITPPCPAFPGSFSAGVFLVRNCPMARELFNAWAALYDARTAACWTCVDQVEDRWVCDGEWAGDAYEQGAFEAHIMSHPRFGPALAVLPYWQLQEPWCACDTTFAMHFAGRYKFFIDTYIEGHRGGDMSLHRPAGATALPPVIWATSGDDAGDRRVSTLLDGIVGGGRHLCAEVDRHEHEGVTGWSDEVMAAVLAKFHGHLDSVSERAIAVDGRTLLAMSLPEAIAMLTFVTETDKDSCSQGAAFLLRKID